MASSPYGVIVTGTMVRKHVERCLQTFLPSYLAEVAAQSGRGRHDLELLNSWGHHSGVENWAGEPLPHVIVITPGLAEPPTKRRDGYDATFEVMVAFVVSSLDIESTLELAELYAAAGRAVFAQHPSLSYLAVNEDGELATELTRGIADNTTIIDESYEEGPSEGSRTLGASQITLNVTVKNIVSNLGPTLPDVDPDPAVLITSYKIDVKKKPL